MYMNTLVTLRPSDCDRIVPVDLQLTIQTVTIITYVVSSNPAYGELYSLQLHVIKFVSDLLEVDGFLQVLRLIKLSATI